MQLDLSTCVCVCVCRGQRRHGNANISQKGADRERWCAIVGRCPNDFELFPISLSTKNPPAGKNDLSVGRVQRIQPPVGFMSFWILSCWFVSVSHPSAQGEKRVYTQFRIAEDVNQWSNG